MPNPKVSIIIPVYNGANYLHQAIDSALNQTYYNCEIIVVNDGSRDDGATEQIALSYGNKIRYFYKENGGVSSAFNLGIQKMEGEYFSWLSHDDIFVPHKIRSQIDFIDGRKDVVVYGDFEIIDGKSKYIGTRREKQIPSELFRYHLIFSHPIHGCTVLIPKAIIDTVGGFDESLKTVQDYDLWYRISKIFKFVHQDAVLARYRIHESQGINTVRPECVREYTVFYKRCFDEVINEGEQCSALSKLTFCMRASIAFYNMGCPEISAYASSIARNMIKTGKYANELRDYFWIPIFGIYEVKRALVKSFHDLSGKTGIAKK
jgi:glycosyltransferase involved in cell wall biosynthesis